MKTINVELPEYTDIQKEADKLIDENRFNIFVFGRRSGKTTLIVLRSIKDCLSTENWKQWICAPSYQACKRSFDMFQKMVPEDLLSKLNRSSSDMFAEFEHTGSSITWRTTSSPKGLVGEGLSQIMIDEAAMMDKSRWDNYLRPSISDTLGKAVFASRPEGTNWFKSFFKEKKEEDNWGTMQMPSKANPYFPDEEWEEAQKLPEDVFRQEFMALFPSAGSDIFPNLDDCIVSHPPHRGEDPYFIGVDPGRRQDYFAVVALDRNGEVVLSNKERQSSWPVLIKNAADKIKELEGRKHVLVDTTGIGDHIPDRLRDYSISNVDRITLNNRDMRTNLIKDVIWEFDEQRVAIPGGNERKFQFEDSEDFQDLREQLLALETTQSRSKMRYEPASGYHDDLVLALSYAIRMKKEKERSLQIKGMQETKSTKIKRNVSRKFNVKERHIRYDH